MANEVGKTAQSGWEIGVSRTLPYPGGRVWEFVTGEGLEIWLGPGVELPRERGAGYETESGTTGEVRSFHEGTRVRLTWRPKDWDHDSTLQITVVDQGKRSTLKIHQEWLADAAERAEQRAYWKQVVERIEAALAER
ncbi:SRPBCC family protein [Amycolatopsis jejuensis]|uniref:SRPBCC family protein n=1 Tax=Amycolatopsis jejuensis TaxID=330084 RepID=UPI0005255A17|nr:SRPBCC domain-containing protein [Amycolatopsis jejuensis]